MDPIDISDIQTVVAAGQILWTEHVALRLRERSLRRQDLISCIQNGEIIEQYPHDTPFASCLILGTSVSGKPLHVVCGLDLGINCYMITAYSPDPDEWEIDNKTRKAGQ